MAIDVEPMIFSEIADHRPLLVALHAFPLDRRMWRPQLTGLAHFVPVLCLDLPGFGRSFEFETQPEMDSWADATATVIRDRSGDRPIILAGLSMGGYVAMQITRRHRELVSGLILCDTRAEADTPEGRTSRNATMRMVEEHGVSALADEMTPKLLSPSATPEIREMVRSLVHDQTSAGILDALTMMRDRPDSTDLLPSLDIPVLVIVGSDDSLTPPRDAESMAAAIPGSELVVIQGAGHLSNLEKPHEFNNAVGAFLGDDFL